MPEREIAWLKLSRKTFEGFPLEVQIDMRTALTIAARGGKADAAKPFKGVGSGVFEIALKYRGDAYRAIYVVRIGNILWVVDAFQKKSKSGVATPQADVDRIKKRVRYIRETHG